MNLISRLRSWRFRLFFILSILGPGFITAKTRRKRAIFLHNLVVPGGGVEPP
jgi:hypothetical protein